MLVQNRRPGRRDRERRGVVVPILALVGAFGLFVIISRLGVIDMPGWLDGGESDPSARGDVTYAGQEAQTASDDFLIDIGDGEATVAVKARQDWDTPGWLIDGDIQPTNGTSSVADPDDGDEPARLAVTMDYCAEGTISTVTADDGGIESVEFAMGEIFVCGARLEHTPDNDAAFRQDDTPTDFHGDFVAFVAGAAEATAAAAPCPTDELARFQDDAYAGHVRTQLAERFGIAEDAVTVRTGDVGATDRATQGELRDALESYANRRDPDDPDREYEALSIDYLSGGDGDAVTDSCWKSPGGTDLDDIESVDAPTPSDR